MFWNFRSTDAVERAVIVPRRRLTASALEYRSPRTPPKHLGVRPNGRVDLPVSPRLPDLRRAFGWREHLSATCHRPRLAHGGYKDAGAGH